MAILSADGKYVTVQKGDNLWNIARDYLGSGTKYTQLAAINNIPNPNLITIGQTVYLTSDTATSITTPKYSTSSNVATITQFGLVSNDTNTLYATWDWSKENTESYKVLWTYDTGNGVELQGTNTTNTVDEDSPEMARQSTYTIPDGAVKVYFKVKPIAKPKDNNSDTRHWTADWSTKKSYTNATPLAAPSTPTVVIDDQLKLTATLDNIDILNANSIVFQVVKNNANVYSTSQPVSIVTGYASYSCIVEVGGEYKVRCYAYNTSSTNKSDWSAYSENAKTVPSSPASITSVKATSETSIFIEWSEVATAESYDIEYATELNYFDNTDQTTIKNGIEANHFEFIGLESGKHYYFRVRAVNTQGESGWTEISDVIIGEAPAAPTTWSSTTTAKVGEKVVLYWVHNSKDGSSQTYAEIEFTVDGKLVQPSITIRNDDTDKDEKEKTSYYELDTSEYKEGTKLQWRVRTACIALCTAYGGYVELSAMRVIDVYAEPSLVMAIVDGENNIVNDLTDTPLKAFPFYIHAAAGPKTQTPVGYHLAITSNQVYESVDAIGNPVIVNKGEALYSKYFDTFEMLAVQFTPGNIDLTNSMSYTATCTVSMDSGLTAERSVTFTVSWSEVSHEPNAEIGIDKDTLTATIRPYCEKSELVTYEVILENDKYILGDRIDGTVYGTVIRGARTDTNNLVYSGVNADGDEILFAQKFEMHKITDVLLSVYRREYDGKFTELAKNLNGTLNVAITDPHPALDYARYRIVAATKTTGAVSYYDMPGYPVGGKSVVIQWNEAWSSFDVEDGDMLEQPAWAGSMLKLPYNIDVSESTNPDVSFIEYIGREHPVGYYGTHVGETSSWSVSVPKSDKETLYALRRLSKWMGDVYVREPSGVGYWANIGVSFSQKHTDLVVPVSFSIRRVEGGA